MEGGYIVYACRVSGYCRNRGAIIRAAEEIISEYDLDEIGNWAFNHGEELLEEVSDSLGEDLIGTREWISAVNERIKESVVEAAVSIYLEEREDAATIELDGSEWIISAGFTYETYPTEAAKLIHIITSVGLDNFLCQ